MNVIVCTTINPTTEAVRKFAAMSGWKLVIVGDRKTPKPDVKCVYLDCEAQIRIDRKLSDLIGWDCIGRRMMGFVWAWRNSAEVVATVDDDNIPLDGWGELLFKSPAKKYKWDLPIFDPLRVTNYSDLWHRGFPLSLVHDRFQWYSCTDETNDTFSVQADLWNGDPDVDAVCREMYGPLSCTFEPVYFPFYCDTPGPFNSQNTFLIRKVLPDYFCFPGIGRMDDIWASFVAQAHGHKVVYGKPSVWQERNAHDPMEDARAELFGFKTLSLVKGLAGNREAWRAFVPERAALAFDRYRELIQ